MATTVSYEPRTGLDTSTGDRSAARMAGGMGPDGTFQRRPAIPERNFQEMFQEFTNKQTETKRVNEAYQKNLNDYNSGKPAPLDSAGTQTVVDANAARTLNNTASNLKISNQGYAEKGNIDLNNEIQKKNYGLGQYANQGGSSGGGGGGGAGTTYSYGEETQASKSAKWQARMDASEQSNKDWEMKQRAANTAQSGVDAQKAVGLENAQAQKYAAAMAANAQRDSAAYAMMGQMAGQGGYKYWGG